MKRKFSQKVDLKFFYAIGTKSCLAFARYENDAFQPMALFWSDKNIRYILI